MGMPGPCRGQEAIRPFGMGVTVVSWHEGAGRAASALNHWAISSAPHASLFLWLPWTVFNTLESFQRRKLYLQDPLSIKSWLTCTLCKTALYGWDKKIKLQYYMKTFNHTFPPKDSSSNVKGRCPKRCKYNNIPFQKKISFLRWKKIVFCSCIAHNLILIPMPRLHFCSLQVRKL